MTHITPAYAQHLKQKHFAQELPKMDFQNQFIAINFGNISPTVLKKINDFKFLGKKKAAAKVLLTMLAKVRALCCQEIFSQNF